MGVMDPANLLGALIRGALIGKPRKRSKKALRYLTGSGRNGGLVNAGTMLTAAGLAWGLFETWQNSQGSQTAGGAQWGGAPTGTAPAPAPPQAPAGAAPTVAHQAPPPIPVAPATPTTPSAATDVPPAMLRLARLTVSAARADGVMDSDEREAILAQARSVGAESFVLAELDRQPPLGEVLANVSDPREKEALYALAFSIVRADDSVTGAERIYLAQVAAHLGLDPATTARLEQETAQKIDAQADAD